MNAICIRRAHSVWTNCRCADCAPKQSRMEKAQRTGTYRRVSSEAAWAVVAPKLDDGWTALALNSAAGLPASSLDSAIAAYRRDGTRAKLGPWVSAQLVNMGPPTAGQIGATVTRRQLRALARIGWGLMQITDPERGLRFSNLCAIRSGRTERVGARIAAEIDAVYDRLHLTPGPARQARDRAAAKGLASSLAYDDIRDLTEQPRGAA